MPGVSAADLVLADRVGMTSVLFLRVAAPLEDPAEPPTVPAGAEATPPRRRDARDRQNLTGASAVFTASKLLSFPVVSSCS
jgi:hypothetical protein